MITRPYLLSGLCLALLSGAASAQFEPRATVDVISEINPFMGLDGTTPLTAGSSADGDGAVIQIGYFDSVATASDPAFWGVSEWASFTPLTGDGSSNALSFPTSVGDSGSGVGGDFGLFNTSATFLEGIHTGLPADYPVRLGVRVYDGTSVAGSTAYNTVTSFSDAGAGGDWGWLLESPLFPPGPLDRATLNLDAPDSPLVWESGAGGEFRTALGLVPEPSSVLLILVGALGLLRRRR